MISFLIELLRLAVDFLINILAGAASGSLEPHTLLVFALFILVVSLVFVLKPWESQQILWKTPRKFFDKDNTEGNAQSRLQLVRERQWDIRNRQALLKQLRDGWIKGVLEKSLYHNSTVVLGLESQPSAVSPPFDLIIRQYDETGQRLPEGTRISDVYEEAGGTLLILGAPGGGKTTLLLELLRDLRERAEQQLKRTEQLVEQAARDENLPLPSDRVLLPVVFPLISWAERQLSFAEWLVDELHKRYNVNKNIGQIWVERRQILPLLDGLDEVPEKQREACITAINKFRIAQESPALVVCSRLADFQAIGKQLSLQRAVVVQPLTLHQTDSYLARGGEDLAPLRTALQTDHSLSELLGSSPLLLNIAAVAYAGKPASTLPTEGTAEERRHQLFAAYIERQLSRHTPTARFSPQHTVRSLSWLAQQMEQNNQDTFFIERLQPSCLAGRRPWHTLLTKLVFKGTVGITIILYFTGIFLAPFLPMPWNEISSMGFAALLWAILVAEYARREIRLVEVVGWSFASFFAELGRTVHKKAVVGYFIGVEMGAVFTGLGFTLLILMGLVDMLWYHILPSLLGFASILLGLIIGAGVLFLSCAFLPSLGKVISHIGNFHVSLEAEQEEKKRGEEGASPLLFMMSLYFYTELGSRLFGYKISGWDNEAILALSLAPLVTCVGVTLMGLLIGAIVVGLPAGLSQGFWKGLLRGEVETRSVPNQGIHRSAKNAFLFSSIAAVLCLLSIWVGGGLLLRPRFLLPFCLFGVFVASVVGGIVWLLFGGYSCVQHFVLRLFLKIKGVAPLRYVAFLDQATEQLFLRKVGGGYRFIHRLLLEHFAIQPSVSMQRRSDRNGK